MEKEKMKGKEAKQKRQGGRGKGGEGSWEQPSAEQGY